MSTFWSVWVIVIVAINIVGSVWLLLATRKIKITGEQAKAAAAGEPPTTGHVYDGIEEYDNPLPGWWFKMFLLTVVFSVVYLVLYPGLGNFKGVLGWTSAGQWQEQVQEAEEKYGPIYARFNETPIEELATNPEALKMGGRLFANNCSVCHGSDGRGAYGFPNLADNDWLYGGSPEAIKISIAEGRNGVMNPWGNMIGEAGVENAAEYVFSLSGRKHDAAKAEEGAKVFATYCSACHGADAKGNQMVGAPNLTDDIWLYGASPEYVKHTIRNGRAGKMPAHKELLKDDKIHLLTAYVYSLSQ
ncbi:MAG: cytochrome-c oxidase, cbb3-type subunit III [Porticoccaceae bacterium]|nr:cytochrome-c oxidase, cbb3-type subunit III [Porticoccaceae bacterium]